MANLFPSGAPSLADVSDERTVVTANPLLAEEQEAAAREAENFILPAASVAPPVFVEPQVLAPPVGGNLRPTVLAPNKFVQISYPMFGFMMLAAVLVGGVLSRLMAPPRAVVTALPAQVPTLVARPVVPVPPTPPAQPANPAPQVVPLPTPTEPPAPAPAAAQPAAAAAARAPAEAPAAQPAPEEFGMGESQSGQGEGASRRQVPSTTQERCAKAVAVSRGCGQARGPQETGQRRLGRSVRPVGFPSPIRQVPVPSGGAAECRRATAPSCLAANPLLLFYNC